MKIFGMRDASGCGYYRITVPLRELAKHGHDVTYGELNSERGVAPSDVEGWPYIIGQRLDNPNAVRYWRRFAMRSKLIYELDDDVFSIQPINWQAYGTYSRPDIQDAVMHSAEVANLVTVTTEPLAKIMRQFNDNVTILPNYIPGWVCDLPSARALYNGPTIGWVGGASHGIDITTVTPHLRRFLDRFPAWTCHMIGTDFRPSLRHKHVKFTPWVDITFDDKAYYRAVDFDIGLAPLDVTSTFNQSKSHIKALEYAARGIPVIASDCLPYRDFVRHGETGFLVKQDHEWLKYMGELASDADLRKAMGDKAREFARTWTIEDGWKLWADAYEKL